MHAGGRGGPAVGNVHDAKRAPNVSGVGEMAALFGLGLGIFQQGEAVTNADLPISQKRFWYTLTIQPKQRPVSQ